jgi:hypothetical protein
VEAAGLSCPPAPIKQMTAAAVNPIRASVLFNIAFSPENQKLKPNFYYGMVIIRAL